jgi:aminoglycoside phosphotransferase (APT) family kinase protein
MGDPRLTWDDISVGVRAALEHRLGGRIVHTQASRYGFSPGLAGLVDVDNDARFFVKAAGPTSDEVTAVDSYRREADVTRTLPATIPAPRLLDVHDADDWIVLIYEQIHGRNPALPWSADELDTVITGVDTLANLATPAPPATAATVPAFRFNPRGWARMGEAGSVSRIDDPYIRDHLAAMIELESRAPAACVGDTLLHLDIRADNVMLTDRGPIFIDWSHPQIGAAWVDLLLFLPSVAMQGGPPPASIFDQNRLARHASGDDVSAMVCALNRPLPRARFAASGGRSNRGETVPIGSRINCT